MSRVALRVRLQTSFACKCALRFTCTRISTHCLEQAGKRKENRRFAPTYMLSSYFPTSWLSNQTVSAHIETRATACSPTRVTRVALLYAHRTRRITCKRRATARNGGQRRLAACCDPNHRRQTSDLYHGGGTSHCVFYRDVIGMYQIRRIVVIAVHFGGFFRVQRFFDCSMHMRMCRPKNIIVRALEQATGEATRWTIGNVTGKATGEATRWTIGSDTGTGHQIGRWVRHRIGHQPCLYKISSLFLLSRLHTESLYMAMPFPQIRPSQPYPTTTRTRQAFHTAACANPTPFAAEPSNVPFSRTSNSHPAVPYRSLCAPRSALTADCKLAIGCRPCSLTARAAEQ